MDFKGFKKVGSDDKSTFFKHDNGSYLKVAHKGLTQGYVAKLKKLPEHPGIDLKALSKSPIAYAMPGDADVRPGNTLAPQGLAKGGLAGQDSDLFNRNSAAINRNMLGPQRGTDNDDEDGLTGDEQEALERGDSIDSGTPPIASEPVQSEDIDPSRGPASAQDTVQAVADSRAKLGLTKYAGAIDSAPLPPEQASSTNIGIVGQPSPFATPAANPQQALDMSNGANRQPNGAPGTIPDLIPPEAQATGAGNDLPAVQPYGYAKANMQDPFGRANQMALQGLTEEKQGMQNEAVARGELGAREAAADAMAANALNRNQNDFQTKYQGYQQERQMLMQEVQNGQVDPQRFVKNMSTGDKIMASIGLILGGMGSGMSGQPNLAAQMLEKNIDNDVYAQRVNMENRNNLLKMNYEGTGDLMKATEITRAQVTDMNSMYIKQLAARATDPVMKAQLMQHAGELDQKASTIYQNQAMRDMLSQAQGEGGEPGFQQTNRVLRMMGPEAAKIADDNEKRHVPGVGNASKEVPADVSKEIAVRNGVDTAMTDMENFARKNSGSLNPATIAQGKAKAALAQNMIRQGEDMGVIKKSETEFMSDLIANPTQILNDWRGYSAYKEVQRDNLMKLNNMKSVYGLPTQERGQMDQKQVQQGSSVITPNIQSNKTGTYQKMGNVWKKIGPPNMKGQ
jgi:hypothetical protein